MTARNRMTKTTAAAQEKAFNPFDEALVGYRHSCRIARDIFGAAFVQAHPMVLFQVHDATPDPEDSSNSPSLNEKLREVLAAVVRDLELARDVTAQLFGAGWYLETSAHNTVFGVYDRVFDGDTATGDPDDLMSAHGVAVQLYGKAAVTPEIVFEIFDRETDFGVEE